MGYKPQIKKLDFYQNRHERLDNLLVDSHTQYPLLAGRSGGQSLFGGVASGNNLTLKSTSHATKGKVIFGASSLSAYDEVNERWGFGVFSPTATVEALAASDVPAGIFRGKSGNTSDIFQVYRSNTAQKVGYFDQYGIFYVVQPANANAVAQLQGNGNLVFNSYFSNNNTGVFAGTVVSIQTAGGGGSVLRIATPTVAADISAQGGGSFGTKSFLLISGQTGAGSYNDLYSVFPNPIASSRTRSYVGNNVNIGNRELSADTATVANGQLHNYNANPYGGELGPECLNESTIPAAATKWSFANGFSNGGSGKAVYTYHASGGTITQTAANMAVPLKSNTYHMVTLTVDTVVGSHYWQIYDPAGLNGTPASVQAGELSWLKYGGFSSRKVVAGTHNFFIKTDDSDISAVSFVLKALSDQASGSFNVSVVSVKEIRGGMIDTQGTYGAGIKTITVDQTADKSAHTWLVDASSANRILTLPTSKTAYRRIYNIKKIDNTANTVTIQAAGAENIDGANTLVLAAQYDKTRIHCDSTQWWVI